MHLTYQMTNRNHANVPPACKIFFPFNEGSGNDVTCQVTGETLTYASAAHDHPNGITWVTSEVAFAGNLPLTIGTKSLLLISCFQVNTLGVFAKTVVGDQSDGPLLATLISSNPAAQYDDETATAIDATASGASPGDGVNCIQAASLDIVNGNLDHYYANAAAAVTKDGTVSLSTVTTNNIILPNEMTISVTTAQDVYGVALFEFTNGIPSDITTALTWMRDNWIKGNKVIYPEWSALT